jgi:hypothetical protein
LFVGKNDTKYEIGYDAQVRLDEVVWTDESGNLVNKADANKRYRLQVQTAVIKPNDNAPRLKVVSYHAGSTRVLEGFLEAITGYIDGHTTDPPYIVFGKTHGQANKENVNNSRNHHNLTNVKDVVFYVTAERGYQRALKNSVAHAS